MCKKNEISQRVLYICDKYATMYTDKLTGSRDESPGGPADLL